MEQPAASDPTSESRLSSEGISFEVPDGRRVSDAVKSGLIKAHCNLGHPSVADLQRFLKLGGAKKEVIEAAGWMKCMTCAHSRRPATNRVSSIPPCQITFGDEVQLDCFCIHDADKKVPLVSVDHRPGYFISCDRTYERPLTIRTSSSV